MLSRVSIPLALMLSLTACAPQLKDNKCTKSLNMEKLFGNLRTLPESYSIREVTQYFKYVERNKDPVYLPRTIFAQDSKSKFLRQSWIGRQEIAQDCSTNSVTTDGYEWTIEDAGPSELHLSSDLNSKIRMTVKKISNDSFVITQTSQSETLAYFEQKTFYRWGESLPLHENVETAFIEGLYEEELNIPERIVNQLEENSNREFLNVEVSDLLNLQGQLETRNHFFD